MVLNWLPSLRYFGHGPAKSLSKHHHWLIRRRIDRCNLVGATAFQNRTYLEYRWRRSVQGRDGERDSGVRDSRPCGSYAWRVSGSGVSKEFIEEFYGTPEAIGEEREESGVDMDCGFRVRQSINDDSAFGPGAGKHDLCLTSW